MRSYVPNIELIIAHEIFHQWQMNPEHDASEDNLMYDTPSEGHLKKYQWNLAH